MHQPQKEKIHRAGLVPYCIQDGEVKMLFMRPTIHEGHTWMHDKDKYQIAKGRIDDSDISTKDAALREGHEELGVWPGNILQVYELGTFLGRTTLFAAEIEDLSLFTAPDPNETAETKWLTLMEFLEIGRELHRSVVSSIDSMIRIKHGMKEAEIELSEYDEFENPLALDEWGRKVNYDVRRRGRGRY